MNECTISKSILNAEKKNRYKIHFHQSMKKYINHFFNLFCVLLFVCFVFWISFVLLVFCFLQLSCTCLLFVMTKTHKTVTMLWGRAVKQLLSWGGGFASYVSKKKVNTCLIRSNIIIFVGDCVKKKSRCGQSRLFICQNFT